MSVLTYHEVSNEGKNIFDRLQKEGIIHEGRIYSPRSHKYFYFEHVFDYTKCDRKTKEEVESREKERDKLYIKSLKEFGQYTDEEMAKRIEENRKCDYHLMPVQRTASGGVSWVLNYDWDDMPSVAIGRKYPDEDFEYFQETEGEVDMNYIFREDKVVLDKYKEKEQDKEELSPKKPGNSVKARPVAKKNPMKKEGKSSKGRC